jgi:GTPase
MKPVIALVGRPNVGKSSLFNRLSGVRKAIVLDEPGVTRDRNYADCSWNEKPFILIDTGGFEPSATDDVFQQMREQTHRAIEEADIIVFLLDGKDGLTASDLEISRILREVEKPVFFAVNKIDGPRHEEGAYEFYRLGVDRIYMISALHGLGVHELLDDMAEYMQDAAGEEERGEERPIRLAVIGKPNVGKSSLVNKILGFERTIVTPLPGTTRDAIDTPFTLNDRTYVLIDTAGIRRKSRINVALEEHSVQQSIKALRRSDVALLLIDAIEGVTEQDAKIAGLAVESGTAVIVVVNKWDSVAKDDRTVGVYVKDIKDTMKFLDFAPIISVSALTGQRVLKIFDLVTDVYGQYTRRVTTGEVNKAVLEIVTAKRPPRYHNRENRFMYATQSGTKPPTFIFFVREPHAVHFSYERYIINQMRSHLGLDKVPIKVIFRKSS